MQPPGPPFDAAEPSTAMIEAVYAALTGAPADAGTTGRPASLADTDPDTGPDQAMPANADPAQAMMDVGIALPTRTPGRQLPGPRHPSAGPVTGRGTPAQPRLPVSTSLARVFGPGTPSGSVRRRTTRTLPTTGAALGQAVRGAMTARRRLTPPGTARSAAPRPAAGDAVAPKRVPKPKRLAEPRPLLPGLQLQPTVHVDDMAAAVAFYEKLGGAVNHGDRDGDWVLMQVGTAQIGLVTRPPDAARGESTVELNFTATMPLAQLERLLRAHGVTVVEVVTDPDLGTRLHLETPDGMPVKIHQVEPDLLV